jgi:hypothetical protein
MALANKHNIPGQQKECWSGKKKTLLYISPQEETNTLYLLIEQPAAENENKNKDNNYHHTLFNRTLGKKEKKITLLLVQAHGATVGLTTQQLTKSCLRPPGEPVEAQVRGDDGERGHDADPDGDVHGERGARLRRHEREHEAGVGHQERAPDELGPGGHPREEPHREQHRAAEPGPARRHEQPVPPPVLVPHDRVAGGVPRAVVLPVPARDVGPQLVGQRRDQRRHHQQRPRVVRVEVGCVRAAAAAASILRGVVAARLLAQLHHQDVVAVAGAVVHPSRSELRA